MTEGLSLLLGLLGLSLRLSLRLLLLGLLQLVLLRCLMEGCNVSLLLLGSSLLLDGCALLLDVRGERGLGRGLGCGLGLEARMLLVSEL